MRSLNSIEVDNDFFVPGSALGESLSSYKKKFNNKELTIQGDGGGGGE